MLMLNKECENVKKEKDLKRKDTEEGEQEAWTRIYPARAREIELGLKPGKVWGSMPRESKERGRERERVIDEARGRDEW